MEDCSFWQHQDRGLALFLDGNGLRSFQVPLPLTEQVVAGPRFHLKPLLPLLAADWTFRVLTVTAGQPVLYTVAVRTGPRRAHRSCHTAWRRLRVSPAMRTGEASPVAPPNTGSLNIGDA